jgi:methionine synthase I (cobalamin-dependent)/5,10-methylenetetrahydrofolate reductase
MTPFLQALTERVLVCDGAMGTMLYARGVFVNRCFDALNVTDPGRVGGVHREYVRAGADVIETNTFGANRVKLRGFGLADQIADINRAGAILARQAAGNRVYVAGAMGPLGIRIEPWGRTGRDEAEGYFREQAQALLDGGVDLFVLETFRDLTEIGAAIAAVRSVSDRPIVAQMTTAEDGSSLDGMPPEQFAPALAGLGPDVIGINCSIGPAPMLETIERIASAAALPLAAQPNAGRPRDIDGRNIYLTSPEYMASYARRFVTAGVRLVGGCCGTTPEHIRQIKTAVGHVPIVAVAPGVRSSPSSTIVEASAPVPLIERSALARALVARRFVLTAELRPPVGHGAAGVIAHAAELKSSGVDVLLVPDGPRGARMSSLALAVLVQQQAGIEVVLQYSCRERTLLGMESDLLGAHALGIRNLMLVTGDVRPVGDYADATVVFEVDSVGLTNAVRRLNQGLDIGGQPIGAATGFHIGVQVNPGADDAEEQLRRIEYKVEAGAEFAITTPIFDIKAFERFLPRLESAHLPIIATIWPFDSAEHAEFMANEVPDTRVPPEVVERLRRAGDGEAAAAEGVAIACEVASAVRASVHGLHIAAPLRRPQSVLDVISVVGQSTEG